MSIQQLFEIAQFEFDQYVDQSCLYALIFLRAISESGQELEDKSLSVLEEKLEIQFANEADHELDLTQMIGADLVSRITIDIVNQITSTLKLQENFTVGVGAKCVRPSDNVSINILAADFIQAERSLDNSNGSELFEINDGWKTFGWKHSGEEHLFVTNVGNNEIYDKNINREGKIESFLVHPKFYTDTEASFCGVYSNVKGRWTLSYQNAYPYTKARWERLYTHGIKPFLEFKQAGVSTYPRKLDVFRIVFCTGIADQTGASFHHENISRCFGVFFTIDVTGFNEQHEGLQEALDNICDSVSKIKNLMRFRMSQAFNTIILQDMQEQQNSLRKQAQMLRLLRAPLEQLSVALDETQEHSQRLRALLYDPSRSIFSVAPRTIQYFEQNRTIVLGGFSWETMHEPAKESVTEKGRELELTLAAIVCEVFGRIDPVPENEEALIGRAKSLLEVNRGFEDELSTLCCRIVGSDCFGDIVKVRTAVGYLKQILYRPMKDGDNNFPLHPLYLIVFSSDRKNGVNVYRGGKVIDNLEAALKDADGGTNLFRGFGLPSPRYAQWLAMLQGIIAYARSEKQADLSRVDIELNDGMRLFLTFSEKVFDDITKPLYTKMREWVRRRDASFTAYGNFMKPFIDFAQTVEGEPLDDDNAFRLEFDVPNGTGKATTLISVQDCTFTFKIEYNYPNA